MLRSVSAHTCVFEKGSVVTGPRATTGPLRVVWIVNVSGGFQHSVVGILPFQPSPASFEPVLVMFARYNTRHLE